MQDISITSKSIPSTPRSGNYPKGATIINNGGGSTVVNQQGSDIDIVKELGTTSFSDANVPSSLRTVKEITGRSISKTIDDTAQGHITFNSGFTAKGVSTIDEADIHTLKADSAEIEKALTVKGASVFQGAITGLSAEFSDLVKAAAITCVGLLTAGTISATDISADGVVGSKNYVSQTTGWRIDSAGNSDFRKIYADELDVQAFTAQVSQVIAGSDFLTKSVSKASYNFVIPSSVGATARLIVDDLEGFPAIQCFANGDYIRLRPINKTGGLTVGNAYGTVTLDTTYGTNGFLNGTQAYTFTATSISNGAGLTIYKGSEVLDYGKSGNGLIKRTVLDSSGSPYMDIDTWTANPAVNSNYTTHVRLGNLAGVANCNGYGLYSDNVFLTKSIVIGDLTKTGNYLSFDTTNGLVINLGGTNMLTAINSKVATTDYTGATIASLINQSATTVTISAAHIDINGAVSFNSLNSDAQARLDNNLIYANLGTQLLTNDWTIGTGGTTNFTMLGLTTENSRITALNHINKFSTVWQCSPGGTASSYDGGWSTTSKIIDKTKTYRFSVFVKKVNANGTFYFGCGNNSICTLNTTTKDASPFFISSNLSNHLNKWLLVTGYVYPYGYTGLTNSSEIWDCDTGAKIIDLTTYSFNWAFDSADVINRCYLYNDAETTNRMYLYNPRLDLVDGKEPSIIDMIGINAVQNYSSSLSSTAKDDVAKGIGYADYNALSAAAVAETTIIVGGKINTDLLEADAILTKALAAGTITAGTATIDGLKAVNIDATGIIKANLLYSPFKSIAVSPSSSYNYNPSIDGNFIQVYASGSSGGFVTINMPNVNTWSGLHVYIRVMDQIGSIFTITNIYSSDGFKFPQGKSSVDAYNDSSNLLHPQGGIYEFMSDGYHWIPISYNINIGPMVHTGQYLSAYDTTLTIRPFTTYVSCGNNNTATVYLPANPIPFQEVNVYRRGSGSVVVNGNGKFIFAAGSNQSTVTMAHICERDGFVYNGTTWDYTYGNYN